MKEIVTVSFSRTEDDRGLCMDITMRFRHGNESRLICDYMHPVHGPVTPERHKVVQSGRCRVDKKMTLDQFRESELKFRKALESKGTLLVFVEEFGKQDACIGRLNRLRNSEIIFQPSAVLARLSKDYWSDKKRKPIYNPAEGDIFKMKDGIFVLVDWDDPFCVGFHCSDGREGSFGYRNAWTHFIEGSDLVRYGTPDTWPWTCSGTGAEKKKCSPSKAESLKFLKEHTEGK